MCSTEVLLYFRELVREYHRKADEFDSEVCTGQASNGVVVPKTSNERHLINSHASELREELISRAIEKHQLKAWECEQLWHDAVVEDALV